jgi:nucleoid DNA-binding protein
LEKLLEIIKDRLINGEYVVIAGFGKWTVIAVAKSFFRNS